MNVLAHLAHGPIEQSTDQTKNKESVRTKVGTNVRVGMCVCVRNAQMFIHHVSKGRNTDKSRMHNAPADSGKVIICLHVTAYQHIYYLIIVYMCLLMIVDAGFSLSRVS